MSMKTNFDLIRKEVQSIQKNLNDSSIDSPIETNSDEFSEIRNQKIIHVTEKLQKSNYVSSFKNYCMELIDSSNKGNLSKIINISNTLKRFFPINTCERILIDLITINALKDEKEGTSNLSTDKLQNSISQIFSLLDKLSEELEKDEQKTAEEKKTEPIIQMVKQPISGDVKFKPVITQEALQTAFDKSLSEYIINHDMQHKIELEKLQGKLKEANDEIEILESRLTDTISDEQFIDMQLKYNDLKEKYDLLTNKQYFIDITQENIDLTNQLNSSSSQFNSLIMQFDQLQKRFGVQNQQLRNENIMLRKAIDANMDTVEQYKIRIKMLEDDKIASLKQCEDLKLENENLKNRLKASSQQDSPKSQAEIDDLKRENAKLTGEIAKLKQEAENIKSSIKVPKITSSNQYNEKLNSTILKLQMIMDKAQNDIPAQKLFIAQQIEKKLVVKQLREKVAKLTGENEELRQQVKLFHKDEENEEDDNVPMEMAKKVLIMQKNFSKQKLYTEVYKNILINTKSQLNILKREFDQIVSVLGSITQRKEEIIRGIPLNLAQQLVNCRGEFARLLDTRVNVVHNKLSQRAQLRFYTLSLSPAVAIQK